ncbi:MAG: DUF302 domain-containing protein [Chloroflexota bacterium]|nr:DUF302 domain-containing protein [Chloroflexota bacterium]
METTTQAGYGETVARVRDALKEEGFGVLTEIDVQGTLKEKLGKDVRPYVILGACNPPLAARALELEPDIGLLLPCNVIVAERDDGTHVGAVDPQSLVDVTQNPRLAEVADEAGRRLRRALERVAKGGSS